MKLRRRIQIILLVLLAVPLLCMLALLGLWGWLSSGERDISGLNPRIEKALQGGQSEVQVKIGKTQIIWEDVFHPARFVVEDIRLLNKDGEVIQRAPSVVLSLQLMDVLFGSLAVKDISLQKPEITLVERKGGKWFWVGENGQGMELLPLLGALAGGEAEGKKVELPFQSFAIEDAKLTLYHEASDTTYVFDETSASIKDAGAQSELSYQTVLRVGEDVIRLKGDGEVDAAAQSGTLRMMLTEANPMRLCGMVLECGEDVPALDLPLSGTLEVSLASVVMPADAGIQSGQPQKKEPPDGQNGLLDSRLRGNGKGKIVLSDIRFELRGDFGTFDFKPHFPDQIAIEALAVKGRVADGLKHVVIESLAMDLGETTIEAKVDAQEVDGAYRLVFDGSAKMMPVNDLYKYWPATLAPDSREWATTAIRGGMATSAYAKIHLEPEDFEPKFFPDAFLEAGVEVEKTSVNYIKGYPKATDVSGVVRFTGNTMTATSKTGKALTGTKLKDAKIFFSDLNHPNVPVEIDLVLDTPAADVLTFIKPPRFDFLKRLPVSTQGAKGNAMGTIRLAFDAFSGSNSDTINWDKVDYDIKADLSGVGGLLYDNRYTLEQGTGKFEASNKLLMTDINASVNGSSMRLGYKEEAGKAPVYRLKGTLSQAMLMQAGLAENERVKGSIGADATIEKTPKGKLLSATLDLTQAAVMLPELGYSKAVGTPATLAFKPVGDANAFDYRSDALKIAGKAWFDANSQALSGIELPALKYGNQDFALRYRAAATGDIIQLKGARADLTQLLDDDKEASHPISSMPPMQLAFDVGTLTLGKDRVLLGAKGHLTCTPERCESADIAARFADKGGMNLRIFREGGARKFSLKSDDAGNLLRAFDAVDKMYGGVFELRGTYDDSKAGNPLNGRITITDFRLKDAPILGRILNLSSLTGLMESLGGTGIGFDKLKGDLHFVNDVATIKEGKASGASLGIGMDGTINLKTSDIRVEGSFAPAHMLNSIVSKIPIIGVVLAGGEGESVFAFNYSVKGSYNDPDVLVNPLSVLTPGFTRKFFDIFDQPPAPEPSAETPASQNPQNPAAPAPLIAPRTTQ